MTRRIKSIYLIILILTPLIACKREYAQLKSSSRRVSSEMRFLQRSTSGLVTALGIGQSSEGMDTTLTQLTPMSQKNFINEYAFLYDALNGAPTNRYLNALEYDSIQDLYKKRSVSNRKLNEDKELYVWYPYWMGDVWKSYNFNLISTISFFTYKIDPASGSYLNPTQISQWRSTDLLDSAKNTNTKVLLNLSLEGEENQSQFLKNESLWNVLLDSVTVLLQERDADGIELEFSEITKDQSQKFLDFAIYMKDNLDFRFVTKKMNLALAVPAVPSDFSTSLRQLDEFVDLFVVKGIDYHEIDGLTPVVSPLRTDIANGYSLEKTINQYLEKGLNAKKSILALPLFGLQWSGTWESNEGYYETNFEKKITLSEVSRIYQSKDTSFVMIPTLDETTMTNYFFLEFADNTSIECWYDDAFTLSKKMDLALYRDFKGIGLWALGYDLGMNEIWNVVEEKFTSDVVFIKDPIAEIDGYPLKLAAFLQKYNYLFFVTFSVLTIFLFFALTMAFSDWRFRDTLLAKQLYRIIFLTVCMVLFIPILSYYGLFEGGNWRLVIIFILGALCSYFLQKFGGFIKINKP
ncbi:spore germination protein YaaH [Mongoliibacter ruber]|uniref:Spore germination protein YaaH n=2 Tax=Mongoliibacter ruber TaxID=1750599 RepID=A0A2T0WPZ3_9BACT|nr:spore germination protein YaaH [Mongoliibacter ruber]